MNESIGILVGAVRTELARAINKELCQRGINLRLSQVQTLRRLGVIAPVSPSQLAKSLCFDAGATSRLLDQLEQKGFLERQADPADRRAQLINLTAEGRTMSKQLIEYSEAVVNVALGDLGDTEKSQLHDYLNRILATLQDND